MYDLIPLCVSTLLSFFGIVLATNTIVTCITRFNYFRGVFRHFFNKTSSNKCEYIYLKLEFIIDLKMFFIKNVYYITFYLAFFTYLSYQAENTTLYNIYIALDLLICLSFVFTLLFSHLIER